VTAASASYSADPISVTDARRLVERTLAGCPEALVADAVLLTSELVSNAVLHARTPFEVEVSGGDHTVRIVVRDGTPDPPQVADPGPEETGGRGLLLVHTLATRWGYEVTPAGKSVWFELET
jgi:anti-sigma regulatory factor (Ser/Thr protein kinase)